MTTRLDRIRGGMYGLLVGDALGVPYEFSAPHHIPERRLIDMSPPPGFARAHSSVPEGTWSDDGAQALLLLASLAKCQSLDLQQFTESLMDWCRNGAMTPDGRVFDIGIQTRQALENFARYGNPLTCGSNQERSNGNGSLMRTLPCAFIVTSIRRISSLAQDDKVCQPTPIHGRNWPVRFTHSWLGRWWKAGHRSKHSTTHKTPSSKGSILASKQSSA
jgi:ADP-ribosyl-[dinitrogen reductase] hydrolase